MKILRAGLLASLAMLSIACTQLPAGNATDTAQRDERVIEGRLDNGLRYRLVPTQEQPGRLDIRLRVDAGSVDERANQVGVAHLLEHMRRPLPGLGDRHATHFQSKGGIV